MPPLFPGRGAIASAYCNSICVHMWGFMAVVKSAFLNPVPVSETKTMKATGFHFYQSL